VEIYRVTFSCIALAKRSQSPDVIYLGFGELVNGEADKRQEGIFVRYRPETKELVGLTVVSFLKISSFPGKTKLWSLRQIAAGGANREVLSSPGEKHIFEPGFDEEEREFARETLFFGIDFGT